MAASHHAPTAPGSLVTRKEIQAMLGGKSRSWVHQITGREDFPAPIDDGDDHRHPIWSRAEVEAWHQAQAVEPEPDPVAA